MTIKDIVKRTLDVCETLAKLTSTDLDDRAVSWLRDMVKLFDAGTPTPEQIAAVMQRHDVAAKSAAPPPG